MNSFVSLTDIALHLFNGRAKYDIIIWDRWKKSRWKFIQDSIANMSKDPIIEDFVDGYSGTFIEELSGLDSSMTGEAISIYVAEVFEEIFVQTEGMAELLTKKKKKDKEDRVP